MENVMDKDKKDSVTVLERIRRKALVQDTRGLNTVEYALLLALIVVVAYGVWSTFGTNVKDGVDNANTQLKFK